MGTSLTTEGIGAVHETLRVLERHGIRPEHLGRLRVNNGDNDYVKRVAEFMLREGVESSTDLRIVRALMGNRIFGPEEWSALYGARLPKKIPAFPWNEDVLNAPCPFYKGKRICETHFAYLGLTKLNGKPLTIVKWHDLHPRTSHPRFYFASDPWCGSQTFATDKTCEFRWYLMPMDVIPNSERKTFEEQLRDCLPDEYEVPTAIAEVSKDILCYRKRGQYPNPTRWGRTEDKSSYGFRVIVGSCSEGVDVDDCWDDDRDDYIGLAASRKSPSAN